jgi:GNAT superfamily N-acetyltransferase
MKQGVDWFDKNMPGDTVIGDEFLIRPFEPGDRRAVRDICAATAWMGNPSAGHVPDEWIWVEFWTRYFTDRQPAHSWVAVSRDVPADGAGAAGAGAIVGYLIGTPDASAADRYARRLIPGIAFHVLARGLLLRRRPRQALGGMIRAMLSGQLDLPPGVLRDYPATFHMNLLASARGKGLGTRLFAEFRARMESLGCRGVHAQPLSVNEHIRRFLASQGFRQVASTPCRAFAHVEPRPIEIQTWVLPVCDKISCQEILSHTEREKVVSRKEKMRLTPDRAIPFGQLP